MWFFYLKKCLKFPFHNHRSSSCLKDQSIWCKVAHWHRRWVGGSPYAKLYRGSLTSLWKWSCGAGRRKFLSCGCCHLSFFRRWAGVLAGQGRLQPRYRWKATFWHPFVLAFQGLSLLCRWLMGRQGGRLIELVMPTCGLCLFHILKSSTK